MVKNHKIDGQRIQITSANYKFTDIVIEKCINGYAWGNIFLGGLIGLSVDALTNNVVKPTEKNFKVVAMPKQGTDQPTKKNNEASGQ